MTEPNGKEIKIRGKPLEISSLDEFKVEVPVPPLYVTEYLDGVLVRKQKKYMEIVANAESRELVPGFGGRIAAALVWDGTDVVAIPDSLGEPREDQMQGTARERLVELAGRACYDSLGKGRSSADYWKHLFEVKHFSILEHAYFTVEIDTSTPDAYLRHLINRPALWVEPGFTSLRVTLNLRHVIEWQKGSFFNTVRGHCPIGGPIAKIAHELAPNLVEVGTDRGYWAQAQLVEPAEDEEKWITLYVTGSRGWSHELVRHGDWTAISQRSTRYVDEGESEWVMHPLVAQWLNETNFSEQIELGHNSRSSAGIQLSAIKSSCSSTYRGLVTKLQSWLESKGIDKVSARKQARGAARGLLGNALETEVIFSANVSQWRHMLTMRAADAADAEIRLGFAQAVLPCLRASRYGDRFQEFELAPAKDGIGMSLSGGGHK